MLIVFLKKPKEKIANYKKTFLILSTIVYSSLSCYQILISDSDLDKLNPLNCTLPIIDLHPIFFDSGNSSVNYNPTENNIEIRRLLRIESTKY